MGKTIGIYKELDDDEKILQESVDLCEIYSKGGIHSYSELEKPDVSFGKAFLTNKRILLLSLFVSQLNQIKNEKGDLKGITGSWLEIPLSSIVRVETPPKITFSDVLSSLEWFGDKELPRRKGELTLYLRSPYEKKPPWWSLKSDENVMSLVIENRDLWTTSIKNAMHEHRIERAKGSLESPFDEYGKRVCGLCGTHYEEDKVKIVQCPECKRFVCRQKKEGLLGGWVETDCFNDEYSLCKTCAKKTQPTKERIKPKIKICSNCGVKIKGKFCTKCGERA